MLLREIREDQDKMESHPMFIDAKSKYWLDGNSFQIVL